VTQPILAIPGSRTTITPRSPRSLSVRLQTFPASRNRWFADALLEEEDSNHRSRQPDTPVSKKDESPKVQPEAVAAGFEASAIRLILRPAVGLGPACRSRQSARDRKFADSPLEQSGFELEVPPSRTCLGVEAIQHPAQISPSVLRFTRTCSAPRAIPSSRWPGSF